MKIGLTSYSMNNYICDMGMPVTEVMKFAKEKGAEHIELVPFGFTLHDDLTGEFNEDLIAEIKASGLCAGVHIMAIGAEKNVPTILSKAGI